MSNKYYHEIDSLRAVAVIAVIINHLNKDWLPGGFLGVDMFFVISGFVVTASLQGKEELPFKDFIKNFYARRIKRLWPSLVGMVLIFILPVFILFAEPEVYVKTALYSLLGFSNIFLFKESSDYFSQVAEVNPFTHTWSLGVEEQFYLIFPLLFFLGVKKKVFLRGFCLLLIISLLGFYFLEKKDPMFAFYLMPTRFWQFGLGILIFSSNLTKKFKVLDKNIIILPLFGMLFYLGRTTEFNFSSAFLTTICTAISLIFIKETSERKYLILKPILTIGMMSYSLYLFHWPVIVFVRELDGFFDWSFASIITLIVILSLVSYKVVESHFRFSKWSRKGVLGCLGILIFFFMVKEKRNMLSNILLINNIPITYSVYPDKILGAKLKNCYESHEQKNLDNYEILKKKFENCRFNQGKAGKVYFFGNSHAEEKLGIIYDFSVENNYDLFFYARGGIKVYPFADNNDLGQNISQQYSGYFFQIAHERLQRGDILIFATPLYHFTEKYTFYDGSSQKISNAAAFDIFLNYFDRESRALERQGVKVFLIGGYPKLERNIRPQNCGGLSTSAKKCRYPFLLEGESIEEIKRYDEKLQKQLGKRYIPVFDSFISLLERDKNPWIYYYNHEHLSTEGANYLAPIVKGELKILTGENSL